METANYASTSNENIISITEKASNITVDGLTLQGTRTDALNVAGENCKIVNCTVKNAAECGINVSGKNNLVESCEVAFIGKDAVVLRAAVQRALSMATTPSPTTACTITAKFRKHILQV
mgnify:CR=1 FL=1